MASHYHTRAWLWQHGTTPAELTLQTLDVPTLEPHQVLVENAYIGLNPVDWKVLEMPEALGASTGMVPGLDGAGTIVAVGEQVDSRLMGQRVAYHTGLGSRIGSFATLTPVDARATITVPDTLGLDVAASLPCPALTAWSALDKVPKRTGAKLLISGAGGGVGRYLVQMAAASGYLVTTLSHPRHWQRLKQQGATTTLESLHKHEQWQGERDYYAVVDTVAPENALALTDALGANGHIVTILGRLPEWPSAPFRRCISMHEVALGALHVYGSDADWKRLSDAGQQLFNDISAQRIEPEPLVVDDFAHLPAHLEALKNRGFSGKALIKV
ncbi:alcohol dehydrogenase catalytic domain-containing protein [Carnimonas nigrificans]|uniref:alcohol dehydrogenase catalytic domain-containing protein n=1 Tax=Carnimonas nigrificans TaxID=64323 RepID=UPI00046F6746|nr:alcohol dehydrogenase catalytic domain-containing protein [Carnimonas nigrificans]